MFKSLLLNQKYAFVIILLIIMMIVWYMVRPAAAAHQCDKQAVETAAEISGDRIDYEYYYRRCLRGWGFQSHVTDKLLGQNK